MVSREPIRGLLRPYRLKIRERPPLYRTRKGSARPHPFERDREEAPLRLRVRLGTFPSTHRIGG